MLAAIVGSGLEARPVKFPSIPSAGQKLLAVASIAVLVGGVGWWVIQQRSVHGATKAAKPALAAGALRVLLVPAKGNLHVGEPLSVTSNVSDASGGIGPDQCALTWRDDVGSKLVGSDTTICSAAFAEPSVSAPGIHHVTADAQGMRGASGTGTGSIAVTVGH